MQFTEVLKMRRSVRRFEKRQITGEELQKLLTAAAYVPVGSNRRQDLHLTVVQNQELLEQLSEASIKRAENQALMKEIAESIQDTSWKKKRFSPFYNAPTVIFISHRKQTLQPGIEYANAACIAEAMHLEAVNLGLGSVLIWGALEAMRELPELDRTELLELPEEFEPLLGLAVGYAEGGAGQEREPRYLALNRLV